MVILQEGLDEYLHDLITDKRDEVLLELETYAREKDFPIIGPLVGRLLLQYAKMIKAKRILELGSGYGYSAIWFAKSSDDVKIICTDTSQENRVKALSNFKRLGLKNIKFILGNGLDIISQTEGKFDIIFCDIDKEDYVKAFELAIPRLNKGGLLITDNTLWYGRVLEAEPKRKSTRGVKEYNKIAFSDSRVLSNIIPIRDGLCISLRI